MGDDGGQDQIQRISRRRFIGSSLLAAAGFALAGEEGHAMAGGTTDLDNGRFRIHFEAGTGRLSVWRNGRPLLVGAEARAMTQGGLRATTDADYMHRVVVSAATDARGPYRRLVARCIDLRKALDFEVRATLYENEDALVIEVICRNVSRSAVLVSGLEPVRTTAADGDSALLWPGVVKVLTNGKMYYDAGQVLDFGPGAEAQSWWNVGLYGGDRDPALVIGYLNNHTAMGEISLKHSRAVQQGTLGLTVTSTYERGFVLKAGQTVTSDPVIFQFAGDPWTALETYANAMGTSQKVKLNPVVTGWCTWSYAYGQINEDEVLRNAEFAAKHLKPYGFSVMQIDDGFYRALGDWEGNANFPHGMKWMAGKIRDLGLTPGIWLAPYCISASTAVAREHPDWLVHRRDGKLLHIGQSLPPDPDEKFMGETGLHALDITHPGAAAWFRELFRTASEDWGYDFIKTDFFDWSILAAERFHDPTVTKAAAYRRGAALMRDAVGPHRHLLDCGPGPISAGYFDSMRIELDQPPVNWKQYFLEPASTAPAMAKRYYYHKRVWINDADQLMMDNMTVTQCQAAASLLGLSGGTVICSDRLPDLEPARLDILHKIMPPYGEAARPVYLWQAGLPPVFALPIMKPFGEWLVLGLFNPSEADEPVGFGATFEDLRLDPGAKYVAWDFWGQRLYDEIHQEVAPIPGIGAFLEPTSCTLLAVHRVGESPFVVGTDRHVTMGGVELESVAWDAASGTLSGVSLGPAGSTHRVYVYLPGDAKRPDPPYLHHDHEGYTLRMLSPRIVRVQVRFGAAGRLEWAVREADFRA